MGIYTQITRDWLERRFRLRSPAGVYFAHMPVYGVGHPDCESGHAPRLARTLRLLTLLDGLEFDSLLDVGGAEGWLAHLARTIFGARTATTDLAVAASERARELFGLDGAAVDSARLPFADGAFDVVTCSEVLEHVENPVGTVLELQRVARRAVILTTEELHHDRQAIDDYLFARPGWPHMELNRLHPDDVAVLFPGATLAPQFEPPPGPLAGAALRTWLLQNLQHATPSPATVGIAIVQTKDATCRRPRRHADAALLDRMLAATVPAGHRHADAGAGPSPWFVARLRAADTGRPMHRAGNELITTAGQRIPLHGGVADFAGDVARPVDRAALAQQVSAAGARAAALLALHDRLALGPRPGQDVFDFDVHEHRRGFFANEQLVPRAGAPPFRFWSLGDDPWISTPCLDRTVRAIALDLRVHNPSIPVTHGQGQVFWMGPGDDTTGEDRKVDFAVPNDGQVHRHVIRLDQHPRWPERVYWLRLDLVNGPCEVDLLRLELL